MSIFTLQIHPVIFELETLSRWANFTICIRCLYTICYE